MVAFFRDKASLIFFTLFLLSAFPFVLNSLKKEIVRTPRNELFKSELTNLNTLEKVIRHADSIYAAQNKSTFDTSAYTSTLSLIIKQRFYHGSLNYTYSENWIAALAGKLVWSHLSSIVIPEDILKHNIGLCSQQTIVFMKLLRMKNINVRSVGLGRKEGPGHFLCEVHYNNSWHLHDVSEEPDWDKVHNHHESMEYYLQNKDSLYKAYASRMPEDVFYTILKNINYGKVNEIPARNMRMFHAATEALVYIFPALFFILTVISLRRKKTARTDEREKTNTPTEIHADPQVHVS